MTDEELERIRLRVDADLRAIVAKSELLAHRLRFAEMVLDREDVHVDGVPWREAARLSESLEGEPVTEPLAPVSDTGVKS